jgi:hypothetical protein
MPTCSCCTRAPWPPPTDILLFDDTQAEEPALDAN